MLKSSQKAPYRAKGILGVVAIVAAVVTWWLIPESAGTEARWMGAVVALMAVSWIFEIVPIAVTSLFPLVMMPLLGIAGIESVAANYAKSTIFLFLGGFFVGTKGPCVAT